MSARFNIRMNCLKYEISTVFFLNAGKILILHLQKVFIIIIILRKKGNKT